MNHYLCGNELGLRAYWSFDEGQGSRLGDTLGQSDGVVVGPECVYQSSLGELAGAISRRDRVWRPSGTTS
jgi:hypothetical protein